MPNQSSPLAASQILDEKFLTLRSKLIDLAATLDRMDRAGDDENTPPIEDDPRIEKIRAALKLLLEAGPDRAEKMQLVFSLPYEF